MGELEPFDESDAATVAGWAGDPASAIRWCSRPLVTAEVVAGWSDAADVHAFVLRDGSQLLGYGELWIDDDEAEVELAHLIVEPSNRGRGVGRFLAELLAARAHDFHPAAVLRVHPDNDVAIRTYHQAGFRRDSASDEAAWNVGQPVAYVWMTHR